MRSEAIGGTVGACLGVVTAPARGPAAACPVTVRTVASLPGSHSWAQSESESRAEYERAQSHWQLRRTISPGRY
jgi:hypothetical protein